MRLHVASGAAGADRQAQFSAWNARAGLEIAFSAHADARLDRAALMAEGVLASGNFSPAAIGAALSHRSLWLAAKKASEPTIICADDACLRGDFAVRAPALLRLLPPGWDVAFLGYDTHASIAVEGPEGLKAVLLLDDVAKKRPGYFADFAKLAAPAPTPLACFQVWGALCYAVSPKGAERLLSFAFPLDASTDVVLFGQGRMVKPSTLDGMINLALQRKPLSAWCALPPLALALNETATSDALAH